MAFISKNSKIRIKHKTYEDFKETRYVAFDNKAVVLNDEEINVWGYNDNHEFWFQCEKGSDNIDEPYLKNWFYRCALNKSEQEGKHTELYLYKYIYRCYKEAYDTTKRTIWYKGVKSEYNTVIPTTQAQHPAVHIRVPTIQFFQTYKEEPESYGSTTAVSEAIMGECMPFADYKVWHWSKNYLTIVLPPKEEAIDVWQTVENNITAIHQLISKHCKFTDAFGVEHGVTPENISQIKDEETLVVTKVKIAKVVYDWIGVNCDYARHRRNVETGGLFMDAEWWAGSAIGVFAKNESQCRGFCKAVNFILNQYDIETINLYTSTHVLTLVNYHDSIGDYSDDESKWCRIDTTNLPSENTPQATVENPRPQPDITNNVVHWRYFNSTSIQPFWDAYYQYPTIKSLDKEHEYTGDNIYAW